MAYMRILLADSAPFSGLSSLVCLESTCRPVLARRWSDFRKHSTTGTPCLNDTSGRPAGAKILRGERAEDLPVEGANRIELVISLKNAKQLRLSIPDSVLKRADRVVSE
jgi:ABC transporter substrate binding protein